MIADTCLLIDSKRDRNGAREFVDRTQGLVTTVITLGELKAGTDRLDVDVMNSFITLPVDAKAAQVWGTLYQTLKAQGNMIGGNDLWIAAIAIANGMPVITRNGSDFGRVPGLKVIEY